MSAADPNNAPVTRSELKAELAAFEERLDQRLDQRLLPAFKELREYIDERTRDMQTELLRAFVDYSNAAGIRFRKLEADTSNIDTSTTQRLGEIERQMVDFKLRLIALEGQR